LALTVFQKILKITTKRKKKFRKTSEIKEIFCFVIAITGHNTSITGKDDDGDDDLMNQHQQQA
jgi:hypothetical protein